MTVTAEFRPEVVDKRIVLLQSPLTSYGVRRPLPQLAPPLLHADQPWGRHVARVTLASLQTTTSNVLAPTR